MRVYGMDVVFVKIEGLPEMSLSMYNYWIFMGIDMLENYANGEVR